MKADPADVALAVLLLLLLVGMGSFLFGVFQAYEVGRDPFGRAELCQAEKNFEACYQRELEVSPLWVSAPALGIAALTIIVAIVVHRGLRAHPVLASAWLRFALSPGLWQYLVVLAIVGVLAWGLVVAVTFADHPVGVSVVWVVLFGGLGMATRGLAAAYRAARAPRSGLGLSSRQ